MTLDVYGVGNTLVDIQVQVTDPDRFELAQRHAWDERLLQGVPWLRDAPMTRTHRDVRAQDADQQVAVLSVDEDQS